MKKTILLIIIIAIMSSGLIGCNSSKDSVGEKPDIELNVPEGEEADKTGTEEKDPNPVSSLTSTPDRPDLDINDEENMMSIFFPWVFSSKMNEEQVNDWEDYIYDKYNFIIDLTYTKRNEQNYTMDIDDIKEESGLYGFVYIQSFNELNVLIDADIIVPLNKYVKEIDDFSSMDDKSIMRFADKTGNLWAFPLTEGIYSSARFYNKGWLSDAGMEAPVTIDEFYEFAEFVAKSDPDGNELEDTYITEYCCQSLASDFSDIFKAFGCYNYGQSPVAYNPLTGKFENFIFNENFEEAITFIKLLKDEGFIFDNYPDGSGGIIDETAYKVASAGYAGSQYDYFNGWDFSHYMTGINNVMLLEERGGSDCFAVLENTDKIKEKITSFLTMIKSSPDTHMDFMYGIKGVQYLDKDDYYEIPMIIDGRNKYIERIGLLFILSGMQVSEKPKKVAGTEDYDDPKYDSMREASAAAREEAEGLYGTEITYSIPLDGYSAKLDVLRNLTYRPTRDLFQSILNDNKSIEDVIEEYSLRLSGLGVFELIDNMNR